MNTYIAALMIVLVIVICTVALLLYILFSRIPTHIEHVDPEELVKGMGSPTGPTVEEQEQYHAIYGRDDTEDE